MSANLISEVDDRLVDVPSGMPEVWHETRVTNTFSLGTTTFYLYSASYFQ